MAGGKVIILRLCVKVNENFTERGNFVKTELTAFGKKVRVALIESDKDQNWLIERVKADTGLYFDRSYLHKVLTGKYENPKIVSSIEQNLLAATGGAS